MGIQRKGKRFYPKIY